ncbi:GNAT family N-acetyltransferase [Paraburkholderia sp. Ac-20340]|uniref:GNAT family N-acetyltransferase n=1 Tax=Paraburkholderia sp. Ac-20340 TaxID=2703888 RepID=UPI00197F1C61|nr:GNAT family N-acetyltransferase [Paraburkholderia sp. Ac-20340]MBN3855709.1 GNAT family N-acetyltransferase [Paraburkholderia sp. Ac-20340]
MSRHDRSLLDNPTWFALTTTQAKLARGTGAARRYDAAVAPFAGLEAMTEGALGALGELLARDEFAVLPSTTDLPEVAGIHTERMFSLVQMADEESVAMPEHSDVVRLETKDVAAMLNLVERTKPGPFGIRTIETGNYIGIRDGEKLIAMAGERMRLDGFVEISAVCVDDDYRGRGIAARLMNLLRNEIRQRGETPFLHVRDDNTPAIALYERLGFKARKTFSLYKVQHALDQNISSTR